jgi:hypothetical protein
VDVIEPSLSGKKHSGDNYVPSGSLQTLPGEVNITCVNSGWFRGDLFNFKWFSRKQFRR